LKPLKDYNASNRSTLEKSLNYLREQTLPNDIEYDEKIVLFKNLEVNNNRIRNNHFDLYNENTKLKSIHSMHKSMIKIDKISNKHKKTNSWIPNSHRLCPVNEVNDSNIVKEDFR
jgi:hypothetical protein